MPEKKKNEETPRRHQLCEFFPGYGIECEHHDCLKCGYNPAVAQQRRKEIEKKYGIKHKFIICTYTKAAAQKRKTDQVLIRLKNNRFKELMKNVNETFFTIKRADFEKIVGDVADEIVEFTLEDFQMAHHIMVTDYDM